MGGCLSAPGRIYNSWEAIGVRLDNRFDGDTSSANIVYSIEAKQEVTEFFKKRKAYVGADGKLIYEVGTDTVSIVLANCTGDPVVLKPVQYREEDSSQFTHHGVRYSLNKVFEQLIEDKTRPLLLSKISDQILPIEKLSPVRYESADITIPVLMIVEDDKYWLLDGNHRAAKAKEQGKLWIRAYEINKDILAKAKV